jgi:hypothetical protein
VFAGFYSNPANETTFSILSARPAGTEIRIPQLKENISTHLEQQVYVQEVAMYTTLHPSNKFQENFVHQVEKSKNRPAFHLKPLKSRFKTKTRRESGSNNMLRLEDNAATFLDLFLGLGEGGADGFVEHVLETFLGEGGALKVLDGPNFAGAVVGFFGGDDVKALRLELTDHILVVSQVHLGTDEDNGDTRGVVLNFRPPFGFDVVEGVRGDDGETNKENIGLRVGQRTKSIVVFLASGIPKTQVHGATINHDVGGVVVKHGRDVLPGEGIGGVRNE